MNLQKEIGEGVKILFISKYSGVLIGILINSILARILIPEDFGIAGVIIVFTTFFNLLSDIGIGVAIVQKQDLTDKDYSDLFKISIIISIILGSIFFILANPFSIFFENEIYNSICKLLSLNVFFSSLVVVPKSILSKNKKFIVIGFLEVASLLISGILAIYLALKGFTYFSLVWRSILSSLLLFITYYIFSRIKIYRRFSIAAMKTMFSYSIYQFFFNFINYFSRNLDNILIGKFIGTNALGIYNQAYQLMMYPISNLTHVISPILHPILAKFQDQKSVILSEYLKVLNILAMLGIPVSIFVYFSADEIIILLLGQKWLSVIPILKVLSVSIWAQILLSSSGSIFQAAGRTDLLFICGVVSAILMISSISLGVIYYKSVSLTANLLVSSFILSFIINFYILISIVLKDNFFRVFKIIFDKLPMASTLLITYILLSPDNVLLLNSINIIFIFILKLVVFFIFIIAFNYKILKSFLIKSSF